MPRSRSSSGAQDWLRPHRLEYVPLDHELAVVRVSAGLARGVTAPDDAALVAGAPHMVVRAPVLGNVTRRPSRRLRASDRRLRTGDHLLWRVTFALPLELLECPQTLFALVANDSLPTRLPEPTMSTLEALCRDWELGARGAGLINGLGWRRAAALGTAVAVAGSSVLPPAAALASTGHARAGGGQKHVGTRQAERGLARAHTAAPTPPLAHAATSTHTGSAVVSSDRRTRTTGTSGTQRPAHTQHAESTKRKAAHHHPPHKAGHTSVTAPPPPTPAQTTSTASQPSSGTSSATPTHRHRHHHRRNFQTQTAGSSGLSTLSPTAPASLIPASGVIDPARKHHRHHHHHHASGRHHPGHHRQDAGSGHHRGRPSFSGGAGLSSLKPAPAVRLHPRTKPARSDEVTEGAGTTVSSTSSSPNSFWTTGMGSSSAEVALLSHLSGLFTKGLQPPPFLIPIYKRAGQRFHIPWEVLAAINSIETDYGRNLNISSAGAVGWMQFMPSTWAQYGVSVNGRGLPNPYDPTDAIFSAARYLAANDGARHLRKAVFAYNHALWYVDAVMWRAGLITDHAQRIHHLDGYSLPLDARYMRTFGRTDDGLDIEDAPDGAAVYSITPGVVTTVASDPTGFGPNYPVVRVTKGPLTGQYIYYGHVAASLVKVGQRVVAGQPIAIMGHTGDAASLGHGHIEIGFSDAVGDPLNHHGATAWTPSGAAMKRVLVALAAGFHIKVR